MLYWRHYNTANTNGSWSSLLRNLIRMLGNYLEDLDQRWDFVRIWWCLLLQQYQCKLLILWSPSHHHSLEMWDRQADPMYESMWDRLKPKYWSCLEVSLFPALSDGSDWMDSNIRDLTEIFLRSYTIQNILKTNMHSVIMKS